MKAASRHTPRLASSVMFGLGLFSTLVPSVAQSVTNLPTCVALGFKAAPYGPNVGQVYDVNYAYAASSPVLGGQDPFTAGLLSLSLRPISPGEPFKFQGQALSGANQMALFGQLYAKLISVWADPASFLAGSAVVGTVPADVVPDAKGQVEVSIIGLDASGAPACRGTNSPFKLQVAVASDAVYGYPLSPSQPLTSGFVAITGIDNPTQLQLTVEGRTIELTTIGWRRFVGNVGSLRGQASVQLNGVTITTFPVSIQNPAPSRTVR